MMQETGFTENHRGPRWSSLWRIKFRKTSLATNYGVKTYSFKPVWKEGDVQHDIWFHFHQRPEIPPWPRRTLVDLGPWWMACRAGHWCQESIKSWFEYMQCTVKNIYIFMIYHHNFFSFVIST